MVSSVSHTEAQAGMCAYASSKGGVVSLTLPLAREFSRFGIRVQTIVPTMFATPMGSNIGNPKLYVRSRYLRSSSSSLTRCRGRIL